MTPQDLHARVLYRDAHILILDKPAGLAAHAGPRGGRSVEDFLDQLAFGFRRLPALAHRLDRDTSGCLVLGRHPKALSRLGRLFAAGLVEKTYWAIVEGVPPAPEGRIDLPIRKLTRKGGWRMATDPAGQPAITEYRVLGTAGDTAWLELRPRTGRTHQLRVHSAALGFPIRDDPTYGRAAQAGGLIHLLARRIVIPYAASRPPIVAVAPPPAHMLASLRACGFAPAPDEGRR